MSAAGGREGGPWLRRLGFFFVVIALPLALLVLADVVKDGWTWGRVAVLVPVVLMGAYLQSKFDIVGPSNVREDQ